MADQQAAAPRQRFHQNDPEEVELVDEDVQNRIVSEIAVRIETQQSRIHTLLKIVCGTSAVVAAALMMLGGGGDSVSLAFSVCVAVVVFATPSWIRQQRQESCTNDNDDSNPRSLPLHVTYYPTLILLSLVLAAVLLWKQQRTRRLVGSLLGCGALYLLCLAATLYVRYDHAASQRLLEQVAAAKYRYKSL